MSKLTESMYDYRTSREEPRAIDRCVECGYDIYFGEEYYDIHGKIICEDYMNNCKRVGGDDEARFHEIR